jgi:hypothetical protein
MPRAALAGEGLPDIVAPWAFASHAFHLAGENVEVSVAVQVTHVQAVVCAAPHFLTVLFRQTTSDFVPPPSHPVAVRVLHPPDRAAGDLGIVEHDVVHAVPVHVFEPHIRAHDVQLPVTIQVAHGCASVYRGTDVVAGPRLGWINRDLVPAQVVLVGHGDDVEPTVSIQVRGNDVVYAGEVDVEHETLERLGGIPRVAVPCPASHKIGVTVAINVKRASTYVESRVLTQKMAQPVIRRVVFVPKDVAVPLPDDELESPIVIQVYQRSLA